MPSARSYPSLLARLLTASALTATACQGDSEADHTGKQQNTDAGGHAPVDDPTSYGGSGQSGATTSYGGSGQAGASAGSAGQAAGGSSGGAGAGGGGDLPVCQLSTVSCTEEAICYPRGEEQLCAPVGSAELTEQLGCTFDAVPTLEEQIKADHCCYGFHGGPYCGGRPLRIEAAPVVARSRGRSDWA